MSQKDILKMSSKRGCKAMVHNKDIAKYYTPNKCTYRRLDVTMRNVMRVNGLDEISLRGRPVVLLRLVAHKNALAYLASEILHFRLSYKRDT